MNALTLGRTIYDAVDEYEAKLAAVDETKAQFDAVVSSTQMQATIGGTYGEPVFSSTPFLHIDALKRSLLKSAWKHVYERLHIARITSARDRKSFEMAVQNPPEFTIDNIRATFGAYVTNPREHVLRGLAEVFCSLDDAYKSHNKVKIGTVGLPKRVILRSFGGYGSWGRERLSDILNALRAVQGQPLIEHQALQAFIDCDQEESDSPEQGLSLRRFKNGNAHLIFDADTLLIINRALAEYYGDVLPDVDGDEAAPQQSREVAKDLQFYPTPDKVAERVVGDLHFPKSCRVLEPSCGDGQLLHHIPRHVEHLGIEVHAERAAKARSYGYSVLTANFLDVPEPRTEAEQFDRVVMNPPFYGRHYLRHIRHAMRFLKPGGTLTAILPATAQYDHGELPEANDFYNAWEDLPAGSFAESGTRVPTGVFTWRKPR